MAVVKDFYVGNTHITIHDDYYRDKTKEEVDAILKRIAARALPILQAQELARRRAEAEVSEQAV